MNNREFEKFVSLLHGFLRIRGRAAKQIVDELRDHLESRIADLLEQGYSSDAAEKLALEEFGDAMAMAHQFRSVWSMKRKRWTMKLAFGLLVAGVVCVFSGWNLWPRSGDHGGSEIAMAQERGQDLEKTESVDSAAEQSLDQTGESISPQAAESARKRTNPSEKTQTSLETRRRLIDCLFERQYDGAPFSEVLADLGTALPDLRFYLDQTAIDDSLDATTKFTFHFGKDSLLEELYLALKSHNATCVIDRRTVKFISLDSARSYEFFRRDMTDCRKLLRLIVDNDSRVRDTTQPLYPFGIGGMGGGGMGGGGMFSISSDGLKSSQKPSSSDSQNQPENRNPFPKAPAPRNNASSEDNADSTQGRFDQSVEQLLISAITTSVWPDEWSDGEARITIVGGILILTAPEFVIEDTKNFIEDLEHMLDSLVQSKQ